jgi:deoxyribodipyrimidine photo-lyase
MNPNRINNIKTGLVISKKSYVLYWMQQSQRVYYNHALEHAINRANELELPLVVFFGLTPNYPDANHRHYQFMLEGLKEVKQVLEAMHMSFVFKLESPEKAIIPLLKEADTLVMDYGYMRHQKQWRQIVWDYANRHLKELTIDIVDTDVIVPVDVASNKAEYGAYTLRPKLHKIYNEYRDYGGLLEVNQPIYIKIGSDDDLSDIDLLISKLEIDKTVAPSLIYHGGYTQAKAHLIDFLTYKINQYPLSNNPGDDLTSKLSMYLHFGQISSLEILDSLIERFHSNEVTQEAYLAFFEQLLVRRELAFNYLTYHKGYDLFDSMTEPWAYITMKEHNHDNRLFLYTIQDYVTFKTHDPYFNAAMKEMVYTGYMHNYMRMYWAKKIIEWSASFEEAYTTIIELNNKYFIDGRDPNSYAGVAWCFGKHDRAWTERLIFGKLRYMNASGLERKFDMEKYINRVNELISFS